MGSSENEGIHEGLTSTSTRTVIIEPATVPAAATTTKP
jgi:hypothetical protein